MIIRKGNLIAFAVAVVAVVGTVWGADYYLKISSIKGESIDPAHTDWIELESWSFGASNPVLRESPTTGGGRSAGKVSVHDLSFTKRLDLASADLLFAACVGDTNRTVGTVQLQLMRDAGAGTPATPYYTITLSDCIVSSYQSSAGGSSGAGLPTESLSLNFTKIEWNYVSRDGQTAIKHTYDLATAKGN